MFFIKPLHRQNNKFKAQPIETADGRFASKLEFKQWCELNMLQNAGLIRDLRRQVRLRLGNKVFYVADFVYYDNKRLSIIIHDAKGVETKDFRIKKEWLLEYFKGFIFVVQTANKREEFKPYANNAHQRSILELLNDF